MQILSIHLYNAKGEMRTVHFKLGQVNIITGRSDTGKSALISIIEYCMSRSECNIPHGVIRDSVAWYAVLYQYKSTQIFIAKSAPKVGASSQSQVYFDIGVTVNIPSFEKLIPNSNDNDVADYLTNLIGIRENINIPPDNQTRLSLEANIKHAKIYLFQRQNIIANPDILFHRQLEDYMPQAIRDTLPYFLGAVPESRITLSEDLRIAKREHKLAERRLTEAENIVGNGFRKGISLLGEARQVGLISSDNNPKTPEEALTLLRQILSKAEQGTRSLLESSDKPVLEAVRSEIAQFNDELKNLEERILISESLKKESDGYQTEASEQKMRLQSINLFDGSKHDTTICPLCSSKLEQPIVEISALNARLNEMTTSLTTVQREYPRMEKYINELKEEQSLLRQKIRERKATLEGIIAASEESKKIDNDNAQIARVLGRISFYLENVQSPSEDSSLSKEVERLKNQITAIESELNDENIEENKISILSLLQQWMTSWAITLELEQKEFPYRLDIDKLTVITDRPPRPIRMNQMGSAANWLGCHLLAHIALHKYFIVQNRPVPHFLFLDQPSQVYFPSDMYNNMEGKVEEVIDSDRVAVVRMFNFLFEICQELSPEFQIIVTEHANLSDERFQASLVEQPWTDGRALIPESWITKPPKLLSP